MTETQSLSIEEVRALVAERTRYDDWLSALEAKREETPARVFERVHGDYSARQKDVSVRLRAHVPDLSAMADEMNERLRSLESTLETLQDERAEAMLRTAVGEFDDHRWEQVRQQVEAQIGELGQQRQAMSAEADEVRSLLESAQSGPDYDVVEPEAVQVVAEVVPEAVVMAAEVPEAPSVMVEEAAAAPDVVDDLVMVDTFGITATTAFDEPAPVAPLSPPAPSSVGSAQPTDEELAELDNALAMFSNDAPVDGYRPAVATPSLNGVDVFDDADLGDLRMDPPRATAVVTPVDAQAPIERDVHGVPRGMPDASEPATARADGFDDLAFLRSVVDPSAGANATRTAAGGDQLKTLRCTECGTMNFPTEWYCERCGGELAAF